MNPVPFQGAIVFPLQRGRCKKCDETYWWGKMNGRGKFYPPFANSKGTQWHICGMHERMAEPVIDDPSREEAREEEEKELTRTDYSGRSISSLIADIQALSTTLRNYGRPHV
jgi:hypothetical protein